MGAEAGGVGERARLGDAAAAGQRLEVAEVRARPPTVRRPASTSSVDAERRASHSACDESRREREPGARAARTQLLAHDVGGDVLRAGRVERRTPRSCAAVGAQPARRAPRRRAGPRRVVDVVDRPAACRGAARRPHAAEPCVEPARDREPRAGRDRGPSVDARRARARRRLRPARAPRRGRRSRRARPAPPANASPVHSRDPERQVVEQLVGEHDTRELERGQLVERDEHRAAAPTPARARRPAVARERAERLVGRLEPQPVALLLAQRRRPLDEHVVQRRRARGSARAARRAARRPLPAPASITRNGSGSPSSRQHAVERARRRTRRTASRPRGW